MAQMSPGSLQYDTPAVQDLKQQLRKGTALDELWQVAHGNIKYADFLGQQQRSNGKPSHGKHSNGKASGSNGKTVSVPEDLVRSSAQLSGRLSSDLVGLEWRCSSLRIVRSLKGS